MLLTVIALGSFTRAFGYSNNFSTSYQVYANGRGCEAGSRNGAFYIIANKRVTLYVDSKTAAGTMSIDLTRGLIIQKSVSFSGSTATFSMGMVQGRKYHLFIYGGNADTYMTVKSRIAQ